MEHNDGKIYLSDAQHKTASEPPLISVVLSFRNEEDTLPELVRRLQAIFGTISVRYELVFVNDDSTDKSLSRLLELRRADSAIRIINMSRRFGNYECFLAGMEYSRGDAVVTMDADLQDPPEVIPELIQKWRDGADVVYTVRKSRAGEYPAKMALTIFGYRVINALSEIELPINSGDFRLIGRRAMEQVLKMKSEKDPYLRGLVRWVGFNQVPVYYDRHARAEGKTHFPLLTSWGTAKALLSGIASFSLVPLLAVFVLGGIFALLALLLAIASTFIAASVPMGKVVAVFSLLFMSIQLFGLGVVAWYLSRIYNQSRNRPDFIIESLVGFDEGVRGV